MIRRLIPQLLVPLALVANLIAADPWLRAFPVNVAAVPLLGAAALSVLVPVVSFRFGARLWLGALIDVIALVLYLLFVVLHDPTGFSAIVTGLHRGPSEILTFALPLVSPRTLMVGPAVLIWVAGAIAGECLTRRWATVLPYIGILVSFGLSYAATQRAAGGDLSSIRLRETLLAGGLLVALLLMRTAQAWVRQDESAESTQADGVLPTRAFTVGVATAAVVAVVASLVVQASAFPKKAATPQRRPLIDQSKPLAPLQFIAGLRPAFDAKTAPASVFDVRLDSRAPGYFGIANVDFYDGSGWSFDRTFRPSGGVLPPDDDAALSGGLTDVTQRYTIRRPLSSAPWIPALYRAQRVTGVPVDIDPGSGMIVPAATLSDGASYTVRSQIASSTFAAVDALRATPDTSTPAGDVQIPPTLKATLDKLISGFAAETGTPSQPALPFLKALQRTLREDYSLSPPAQGSALGTRSPAPSSSSAARSSVASTSKSASRSGDAAEARPLTAKTGAKSTPRKAGKSRPAKGKPSRTTASPPRTSASPSATPSQGELAGGTGFADVVASVLGQHRAGTPEQFATLVALIARELGVPARVVTGFRVLDHGAAILPAGTYHASANQAWTWAEVPIVGQGWLVLDASPSEFSDQSRDPATGASPTPTPSDTPSQAVITQTSGGGHAVAPKAHPPAAAASPSRHGLLVALLLALSALALALLLILLSRKQVRRARRRRVPDPRAQLLGAWQESLDMLTESGLPELTTLTSREIAELAGEQFGSAPREQTAVLGNAANAVAYSSVTVVAPREVDEAWATQRNLRRAVRKQLSPGARLAAAMRYSRARKARATSGPASWADEAAARAEASLPKSRLRMSRGYRGRRRR